ncbi:hypothetical protein AAP_04851 [Ascosphaera apis ARSEF 7405]|uniref:Uncharacterized protein n=1 Tax=Ascosphaera apis ARSEF 7405 TaxID=392613 RepID=A0A167W8L3_9EURO|nr:hypothetical protein AAP_04851 [Ascosphaera apis ARSEF 7405]
MPSTVLVYEDVRPRPHNHTESHLNVDPAFIPRRVDPDAFINGATLVCGSFVQSYTSYDPSSADCSDPNALDTSRVPLLPTSRLSGLVESILEAHACRRHLVLSPDEVLGAIIGQFAYLLKGHKSLRSKIWQSLGSSKVELNVPGNRADGAIVLRDLKTQLQLSIANNLVDPELASWFEPLFTTTTEAHQLTNLIMFLGGLTEHEPGCIRLDNNVDSNGGIVTVTMAGQLQDWIRLREMVEFLGRQDEITKRWHQMLDIVLRFFIFCYAKPSSPGAKQFWRIAVLHDGGRLAKSHISGWVTAFCLWQWTGEPTRETFGPALNLKGVRFRRFDHHTLPPAFTILDVGIRQINILGMTDTAVSPARLMAGIFGSKYLSDGEIGYRKRWIQPAVSSELTAVQPLSAWFLYQTRPEQISQRGGMPGSN